MDLEHSTHFGELYGCQHRCRSSCTRILNCIKTFIYSLPADLFYNILWMEITTKIISNRCQCESSCIQTTSTRIPLSAVLMCLPSPWWLKSTWRWLSREIQNMDGVHKMPLRPEATTSAQESKLNLNTDHFLLPVNIYHQPFSATRTFPEPYYASLTHSTSSSPPSPIFIIFIHFSTIFWHVFTRFHTPLTYDIHIRQITPISAHSWPFLIPWTWNHPV